MRFTWIIVLGLLLGPAYADDSFSPGLAPNAQGQVPSMVGGVAPSTILVSNAAQVMASTGDTSCFSATAVGPGATIPGNGPYAGNTYHIRCRGVFTTPLTSVGTLTVKIKWASTVVSTVTTGTLTASATNLPFDLDVICTIQTSGSSGTMSCGGAFNYSAALTGLSSVFNSLSITSPATINTTVSSKIDATMAFSTVAGGQTATGLVGVIEVEY